MKDTSELLLQSVTLLQRQRKLADQVVCSGEVALRNFEAAVDKGERAVDNVLEVLNYAFCIIDHLVRFQKTAGYIPQLNHRKQKECVALTNGMGDLKKARNQHQHLNNEILNSFSGPLLGTVSWISNDKNYIASYQDIGRTRSFPGMIYDTLERRYINEFCYVYNDKYYDLQKAIESMRTFSDFIKSAVRIETQGVSVNTDELAIAMCVRLNFTSQI